MSKKIIVALDFPTVKSALDLVDRLDPRLCRVKIGKELFTLGGPQLLEAVREKGFEIFLDLKYHDIPNTVTGACKAAAELGVWMLNVHATGGPKMMDAAANALVNHKDRPSLIVVTILTSHDQDEIQKIGYTGTVEENVLSLAMQTKECGLDGVVCSGIEASSLKKNLGSEFVLVTPGIKLIGDSKNDQERVMTPVRAVQSGADYLVIGRAITGSDDPIATLHRVNNEIIGV